ncbi:hypothetical protein [Methylibium sp.]|uniref:hypothetical protein n=1 Tax=Methylibium sp. TaxID=2067992 RepID=UPI003BACAD3D
MDFSDGRVLTCDAEIERASQVSGCMPKTQSRIELNLQGVRTLELQLAKLTSGAFSDALASAERAYAAGNHSFMKSPAAWATTHLRRIMVGGDLEIASKDGMALAYVNVLQHAIARWQHHPMFTSVAKGFVYEFHHSITMLATAGAMSDMGNRIGFTQTAEAFGRSPDMYVSVDHANRISIEIKAPVELQWPRPTPTLERFTTLIANRAKDASKQFGEAGVGLLVIGASELNSQSQSIFEAAVEAAIHSKNISRRIAAIVGVHLSGQPEIKHVGVDSLATSNSFRFFLRNNPAYIGPAFLRTVDRSTEEQGK